MIEAKEQNLVLWADQQRNDPELQQIITDLINGIEHPPFTIENGTLYHKGKLVVPINQVENVLRDYHDNNAHLARNRLFDILKKRFFWRHMTKHIYAWVNSCLNCRRFKPDQPLRHGLLEPIKVNKPFETVGVDIIGPFHLSTSPHRYIVVFIDLFTNWIQKAPLKSLTADELSDTFYKCIITRHSCPQNILSDQGT